MYKALEKKINQTKEEYTPPTRYPFESEFNKLFTSLPPKFGTDIKSKLFPKLKQNFLAHGSYGACADPIIELGNKWKELIETDPVVFYYEILYPRLIQSIRDLSEFVHTKPNNIVLVNNVEYGIQTILSSLKQSRDIICFDFNYEAVSFALSKTCKNLGSELIKMNTSLLGVNSKKVKIDSITSDILCDIVENYLNTSTNIQMAVFEHITSPTAILLPIERFALICKKYNVLTLIDGAHGIGQLELNLDALGVDFYTSNLHKWLYSPRGCAFLYVSPEHHESVHPLITTWGDKSGITSEFIWQGTMDYSPFLCIPGCIKLFNWLESSIQRNNMLAKWATGMLCRVWKTKPLVDESMQAAMITILVPSAQECHDSCSRSILHDDLLKHYGIQVPVFAFRSQQYMRISIAIYNTKTELLHLAYSVLRCLLYPLDYEGYSLLETYK